MPDTSEATTPPAAICFRDAALVARLDAALRALGIKNRTAWIRATIAEKLDRIAAVGGQPPEAPPEK